LRKKKLPIAEILELCVGDTLDPDSKSACKASLLEVRSKIAVRSDYIRGRNLSYRRHCFPQSSVGLTDVDMGAEREHERANGRADQGRIENPAEKRGMVVAESATQFAPSGTGLRRWPISREQNCMTLW
jgi:hypothetical protein